MTSITTRAIDLGPTGNAQVGYYFLSLVSGRCINHRKWTEFLITEDVIRVVNVMGDKYREGNDIIFGMRDGTPIDEYEVNDNSIDDGNEITNGVGVEPPDDEQKLPPPVIEVLNDEENAQSQETSGVDDNIQP